MSQESPFHLNLSKNYFGLFYGILKEIKQPFFRIELFLNGLNNFASGVEKIQYLLDQAKYSSFFTN